MAPSSKKTERERLLVAAERWQLAKLADSEPFDGLSAAAWVAIDL